ncbi:SHOCT domain-containing protein [Arthrobacter glacialis]|uniref:SHOCT domain-containing protein n=1 Tax=Arthrobacter glacialis TaxID=1664 RepID=UPI000CD3E701|nr:SHOCT domain-containing protein [Arthrobacter glacialis]POH58595.1 hypothetical protein CVS28_10625 [Arthrobacter glacialis]
MPGLLRGIARTAIISGTATAVSNNVSRRQANRWSQQASSPEPLPTAATPAALPPSVEDPVVLLTQLAELYSKGLLTDEEFTRQKQRILG